MYTVFDVTVSMLFLRPEMVKTSPRHHFRGCRYPHPLCYQAMPRDHNPNSFKDISQLHFLSDGMKMSWTRYCRGPFWFPKAPEIKNFREGNSSRTWLCSSSIFELQNEQSPSTTPDQTKLIPQPRKSGQQPMDRTNVQQPLWFCSTDVPFPFQDMAMPLGYAARLCHCTRISGCRHRITQMLLGR